MVQGQPPGLAITYKELSLPRDLVDGKQKLAGAHRQRWSRLTGALKGGLGQICALFWNIAHHRLRSGGRSNTPVVTLLQPNICRNAAVLFNAFLEGHDLCSADFGRIKDKIRPSQAQGGERLLTGPCSHLHISAADDYLPRSNCNPLSNSRKSLELRENDRIHTSVSVDYAVAAELLTRFQFREYDDQPEGAASGSSPEPTFTTGTRACPDPRVVRTNIPISLPSAHSFPDWGVFVADAHCQRSAAG
ncbi:uncharacterized protein CIMG_12723 [Coccidioides immitis RS]|uniref:Uncharacterized protein n=1 Tax=Coccidioides immitis (strain RS) TaxID=246410 RepID=A0A0D8JRZ8_COCIM|nr:uncharacterized protein CIMG_12723 [Coccidioides immitis RS]KJF60072.1 hypothetical protein CIMG_12723 [Coccidioides immitis RS]